MRPLICNYYLTYRCNARCGFCSIWSGNPVPRESESPPSVVIRNLMDARRLGVRVVDFTGGEPLLYDGLPEVLAAARRLGLHTTLTTNGIRYDHRAGEIAGLVDILQFSLHGPDRITHDAVTGTPSFDHVIEGIELARVLGERPSVIHTVTDEGIDRVPEVIGLARSLGVLLFLNPCFSYFGNPGLSPRHADTLERLAQEPGVTVDRGFLAFLRDGGNRRKAPRCLAVSSTIVIGPDDSLILPCFHFQDSSIPIKGRLLALRRSPQVRNEENLQGRRPCCEGCAVNCYIRASLFRKFDRYFLPTVQSGLRYALELARSR